MEIFFFINATTAKYCLRTARINKGTAPFYTSICVLPSVSNMVAGLESRLSLYTNGKGTAGKQHCIHGKHLTDNSIHPLILQLSMVSLMHCDKVNEETTLQ
jgi:hypothetical protein